MKLRILELSYTHKDEKYYHVQRQGLFDTWATPTIYFFFDGWLNHPKDFETVEEAEKAIEEYREYLRRKKIEPVVVKEIEI